MSEHELSPQPAEASAAQLAAGADSQTIQSNTIAAAQTSVDLNGFSDLDSAQFSASMNGSADPSFDSSAMMNGYAINDMTMQMPAMDPYQAMMNTSSITADEIALYDRQIRLWGMKAQENIRSANIILVGMRALGNEIAKNLVLAGVGTLTILDPDNVTEEDLSTQFLISEDKVGHNRAEAALEELQKLNPRVSLFIDKETAVTKLPEYWSNYDITITTGLPLNVMSAINLSCRMAQRKFYAADTYGMYGYVFADLVVHQYVVEKERGNVTTKPMTMETNNRSVVAVTSKKENNKVIEVVTKQEMYSPLMLANSSPLPPEAAKNRRTRVRVTPLLSCLRALFEFQNETDGRLPTHNRSDIEHFTRLANARHLELQLPMETLRAEFLRSFLQNLGGELSAVTAYIGGFVAQDVINVLGEREQPLQNWLVFDGEELKGTTYALHPIFDEATLGAMNTNGNAATVSG